MFRKGRQDEERRNATGTQDTSSESVLRSRNRSGRRIGEREARQTPSLPPIPTPSPSGSAPHLLAPGRLTKQPGGWPSPAPDFCGALCVSERSLVPGFPATSGGTRRPGGSLRARLAPSTTPGPPGRAWSAPLPCLPAAGLRVSRENCLAREQPTCRWTPSPQLPGSLPRAHQRAPRTGRESAREAGKKIRPASRVPCLC